MIKEPFDINRRSDSKPGAILPMLGLRNDHPLNEQFSPQDVDSYIAALHHSIGDTANLVKSRFLEAAKALGGACAPGLFLCNDVVHAGPGELRAGAVARHRAGSFAQGFSRNHGATGHHPVSCHRSRALLRVVVAHLAARLAHRHARCAEVTQRTGQEGHQGR